MMIKNEKYMRSRKALTALVTYDKNENKKEKQKKKKKKIRDKKQKEKKKVVTKPAFFILKNK